MPDCHWSACPGDRRPGQDLNGLNNSHANPISSKKYSRPGQDVRDAHSMAVVAGYLETR
jgi:hypothetical protein